MGPSDPPSKTAFLSPQLFFVTVRARYQRTERTASRRRNSVRKKKRPLSYHHHQIFYKNGLSSKRHCKDHYKVSVRQCCVSVVTVRQKTSSRRSRMISSTSSVLLCICVTRPKSRPCLLYTSPSPRDRTRSRMPSSA